MIIHSLFFSLPRRRFFAWCCVREGDSNESKWKRGEISFGWCCAWCFIRMRHGVDEGRRAGTVSSSWSSWSSANGIHCLLSLPIPISASPVFVINLLNFIPFRAGYSGKFLPRIMMGCSIIKRENNNNNKMMHETIIMITMIYVVFKRVGFLFCSADEFLSLSLCL